MTLASHPDPPDSYQTLKGPAEAEIKVQRSRFIARVAPAEDETAAKDRVREMAARFHDARHTCHAWRLGPEPDTVENRNDDGEPAGTAGDPILVALRRADLVNVVGIVVRYFGGVKLGTGGLARAYGQAVDLALAQSDPREVLLGRTFGLTFPYARQKTLEKLLAAGRGRTLAADYGTEVTWRLWLPHSTWRAFQTALTEKSAGQLTLTSLDDLP